MSQQKTEARASYEIAISRWDHSYSYIADYVDDKEVDEFIHLETLDLQGKVIRPRVHHGVTAKLMIACERVQMGNQPEKVRPVIGSVRKTKRLFDFYVAIPKEHFSRLVSVATTGRIAVVKITTSLTRRQLVRSFHVSTNENER